MASSGVGDATLVFTGRCGSAWSSTRWSSLTCAGWLPLDGVFGTRALPLVHLGARSHSEVVLIASARVTLQVRVTPPRERLGSQVYRVARVWHQPASSRAIATLAMAGFLCRSSKASQRSCSLLLAWCALATTGPGALFQRARIVLPGR